MQKLDERIPFIVKIYCIGLLAAEHLQDKYRYFKFETKWFLYLMFPSLLPGISQDAITRYFNTSKSTTTRVLIHLEKENLIYKVKNKFNKRVFDVFLTEKGHKITEELIKWLKEFENKILENIDETHDDIFKNINSLFFNALFSRKK